MLCVDNQILTPHGYKIVTSLQVGDKVFLKFHDEIILQRILAIKPSPPALFKEFRLDNSTFYVQRGDYILDALGRWQMALSLGWGSQIASESGDCIIRSKQDRESMRPRRDIEVSGAGNWILEGGVYLKR